MPSSALVSRRIMRGPTGIPGYAGMAYNAAMFGYRNRAKIGAVMTRLSRSYMARKIQKKWRSKRARRATIGRSVRSERCHRERMLTTEPLNADSRTIYFSDLTNIGKTTTNDINGRQSQSVNISGIRTRFTFRNLSVNVPCRLVCCMLVPRNSNTISNDGFFRDYNASRDVNFSTALTNQLMTTLPISTDKYTVLWRINKTVMPASNSPTNYGIQGGKSFVDIYRYTPIKRQVRYNDDTGTECENKFFFVWWFDNLMTPGGGAPLVNSGTSQADHIAFYRDK